MDNIVRSWEDVELTAEELELTVAELELTDAELMGIYGATGSYTIITTQIAPFTGTMIGTL